MSGDTYDVQGEVRDALNTAVEGYGKRVLNDPRVLGNLVTDLLPDLPRERSLLVTGAEAGVAAELTQHVEGQRMDADTAVSLVARSLAESRSLEPAASMWVATEYAKALGYQVRSQVPPAAVTVRIPRRGRSTTTTETVDRAFPPPFPPPAPMPPVNPAAGQVPPTFPPPGQMPPTFPGPRPGTAGRPRPPAPGRPRPQQRKSRLGLFLGGGAAAVLVLYLVSRGRRVDVPVLEGEADPDAHAELTPTATREPEGDLVGQRVGVASASASASSSSSASATATGSLAPCRPG